MDTQFKTVEIQDRKYPQTPHQHASVRVMRRIAKNVSSLPKAHASRTSLMQLWDESADA
jgi:hypothetical protein